MKEPFATFLGLIAAGIASLVFAGVSQQTPAAPSYMAPVLSLAGMASIVGAFLVPIVALCNASSRWR